MTAIGPPVVAGVVYATHARPDWLSLWQPRQGHARASCVVSTLCWLLLPSFSSWSAAQENCHFRSGGEAQHSIAAQRRLVQYRKGAVGSF